MGTVALYDAVSITKWRGSYEPDTYLPSYMYGWRTDNRTAVEKSPPGGWRPPLPYARLIEDGELYCPHANVRADFTWWGIPKCHENYAGPTSRSHPLWYSGLPEFPTSMLSRCEIKALKRLKDSNVNIAVAFAERGRTADMLTNTVLRLRKGVKAARRLDAGGIADSLGITKRRSQRGRSVSINGRTYPRGRRSELASTDQRVQDLWLEFQYGWNPLLSDSKGVIEELARDDLADPDRYRTTVIGKDRTREVIVLEGYAGPLNSGTNICGHIRSRRTIMHKCKVRLDYKLSNPALAQASALGLTNPLEVAWELVPFSFVADWFLPIGSYLGALDASLGWTFLGGSKTRVTKVNNTGGWTGPFTYNSVHATDLNFSNGSPKSSYRLAYMNREVYGSSPSPWYPSFDGDLTRGQRFNNALALLIQAFR